MQGIFNNMNADIGALTNIIARRAVWDTDLSPETYLAILRGEISVEWPTRAFCVARLLECSNWFDAVTVLSPQEICKFWPEAERHVRSRSIKLGMEYACRILH